MAHYDDIEKQPSTKGSQSDLLSVVEVVVLQRGSRQDANRRLLARVLCSQTAVKLAQKNCAQQIAEIIIHSWN